MSSIRPEIGLESAATVLISTLRHSSVTISSMRPVAFTWRNEHSNAEPTAVRAAATMAASKVMDGNPDPSGRVWWRGSSRKLLFDASELGHGESAT